MKKVLFLEPNMKVSELIADYFNDKNMKLFIVDSAQQAIHVSDNDKPDLVVLELAVPDQNGVAFLHEFRSYSEWQSIPILIHTVIPPNPDISQKNWDDLGVVGYLYKPHTKFATLNSKINSCLA